MHNLKSLIFVGKPSTCRSIKDFIDLGFSWVQLNKLKISEILVLRRRYLLQGFIYFHILAKYELLIPYPFIKIKNNP